MKFLRKILPFIILAVVLAGSVAVWINRSQILDWWYLRGYEPSAEIEALAVETGMSGYAQRLFFVNHPSIDNKKDFNRNCAGIVEEVAVLGCYHGDRLGIYLYDITDERLHGVEQVTAVHEMLHQAYDRLSSTERESVDKLLDGYYNNQLEDQKIRDKIALYEKDGTENLINEMHSIFATEIENLPKELEQYYSKYFTDRNKVIAFHKQSQAAFEEFRQKIDNYDQQLAGLQRQIDSNETQLSDMLAELQAERDHLDQLLAEDSIVEYNAGVPAFNTKVNHYNDLLQSTQGLVDEYNKLVEERNDVAVQASDLSAALDSRLTPQ